MHNGERAEGRGALCRHCVSEWEEPCMHHVEVSILLAESPDCHIIVVSIPWVCDDNLTVRLLIESTRSRYLRACGRARVV